MQFAGMNRAKYLQCGGAKCITYSCVCPNLGTSARGAEAGLLSGVLERIAHIFPLRLGRLLHKRRRRGDNGACRKRPKFSLPGTHSEDEILGLPRTHFVSGGGGFM